MDLCWSELSSQISPTCDIRADGVFDWCKRCSIVDPMYELSEATHKCWSNRNTFVAARLNGIDELLGSIIREHYGQEPKKKHMEYIVGTPGT